MSGTGGGPLAGVRVLDLSRLLPGASCTRLLRDLGAEVVKVERPGVGDDLRHEAPEVADGVSAVHQFLDAGKRSVALDLKNPDDVALVLALGERADAVLESFRPGVADRLGVGYAQFAARNPAVVYVSLSGYGQDGPRSREPGHDINFCAEAGVLSTTGSAESGPALSAVLTADMTGGTLAATAVLAGVLQARATGRGSHVDVSLYEAAHWALALPMSAHLAGGPDWANQSGPLNGGLPCYRVYACADGRHIAVGALEPVFWERLVALLDRPDLADRRTDPTAIGELAAVFAQRPLAEWLDLLGDAQVCVSPVRTLPEAAADPHLRSRGGVVTAGEEWTVEQPGCPIRFAGHEVRRAVAPELDGDGPWARDQVSPVPPRSGA